MQMHEWAPTAVQQLIEMLGQVPTSVPGLLQFLAVLPDDVNTNTRIPISVSLPGSPIGPSSAQFRTPSLGRRV